MEMPEHTWFLLSRNLSGEATEAEKKQLMQLLEQQPALQQQFEILQNWWAAHHAAEDAEADPGKIGRILQRAAIPEKKPGLLARMKPVMARIAIITLVISAAGLTLLLTLRAPRSAQLHEVLAQNGSRTRTILPDGSTVWLNAGSKLTYKPGLPGKAREVTLDGEAYFDIVKRAGRQFIVHTKEIDINVLGTAFNVKSYSADETVETTLIRGLVTITRNNKTVYLQPHQKFVLSLVEKKSSIPATNNKTVNAPPAEHIIHLDTLDEKLQPETAWIYNRLEFRGESFEELAKKLERWYNINVRFQDEQVKQLTFNGSLENETVEQAFKALQAAVPFRYTINENEISVRSY